MKGTAMQAEHRADPPRSEPPPAAPREYGDFAEAIEAAEHIKYAMCVTHHGILNARPLTTQAVDPDGTVWFFVGGRGDLDAELTAHPDLLLLYADTDASRYLSLAGRGTLLRDTALAKRLWNPMASAFFSGGPEDPDLRVLRVDVARIELWEPNGTRMGQFLRLAAAAMGAEVRADNIGRHEVLTGGTRGPE
jgi:general stress protein 26